jgi:hypothetical protein
MIPKKRISSKKAKAYIIIFKPKIVKNKIWLKTPIAEFSFPKSFKLSILTK